MISGPGEILPFTLEIVEEVEDELGSNMFDSEGSNLDTMILCGEGQKKLEGIPVGSDGVWAHSLDVGEIVVEKLMDNGVELHAFLFCQREKSTSFCRLCASATLRYTAVN